MPPSTPALCCVSAALLVLSFPCPSSASDPSCAAADALQPAGAAATESHPHGIAFADFDADGKLDFAVANSGASSVSVHLGTGGGAFFPGVSYPVTGAPFHVLARDFDGDGIADLLVASYNSGVVSLLPGLGSGGGGSAMFAPAVTYPAGTNPTFALDADFNADGHPDLAVLNLTEGKLSVLLGQQHSGPGQGVFSAPVAYALGNNVSYPATAAAGDFNGDGILDLAVALYGANQVALLSGAGSGGTGSGAFLPPSYLTVGTNPWNVAARDLNGDGILDLLVSDASGLGILIGNGAGGVGNGTFLTPVHYGTPSYPQGMALGDFTRDGITDVVVGLISASYLEIFPGAGSGAVGDGTFGAGQFIGTQIQPFALAAPDFSGDGHADLAAVNYGSNVITLYLGACGPPSQGGYVGEWTPQGEHLFVGPGDQSQPAALADGSGGAFVAWRDTRAGNAIYVTRIGADGHPVSGWPLDGQPVCTASGDRFSPALTSDGAGGTFVGWLDTRNTTAATYLQHLLPSGAIAPATSGLWPVDGQRVCPIGIQGSFSFDPDGSGGVLLATQDVRGSQFGMYAFRVSGVGIYPAGWPNLGKLIQDLTNYQAAVTVTTGPTMVGDGTGGGYVAAAWSNPPGLDHYPASWAEALFRVTSSSVTKVIGREQPSPAPAYSPDGSGGVVFGVVSSTTGEDFFDVSPASAFLWTATLPEARPYLAVPDASGGTVLGASGEGGQTIIGLRINRVGAVPPSWNPGGSIISSGPGQRSLDAIASDGAGGAYYAWTDGRFGRNDLYATHVIFDGSLAPGWTPGGDPVAAPLGTRDRATMIADGKGGAIVLWSDTRYGARDLFGQKLSTDIPVPTLASLYRADALPGYVRLVWIASTGASRGFEIDRRDRARDWSRVADADADGTGRIEFEDRNVTPGARYGYRIALRGEVPETFTGEVWVDVPAALELLLDPPRPDPVQTNLDVSFVLPSARPAVLDLFDVAGRIVLSREVGAFGPGRHVLHVAGPGRIDAGVHFLRLKQGAEARIAKVVFVR